MSVLVSGSVFWQLRGIGTAMVDANLPAADDSGEDINVTQLASSELETPDVWEATLPPLTDIAGENVARIAESQLGYTESSVNFVHAEDGETHNGYTRYGAWYGNPYGEWNTMFTYFCMDYAGVSDEDIPSGSGCWAWSLELENAGLITPVTRGSPQRGDILLMDCDTDGKADRSCIVSSADEDELIVIEGDTDGSVAECVYSAADERLIGMVSLDGITAEPPVLPEEPAQLDFNAESESGIRVEAHADWRAFPYDTVMSVFDISRDEAIQTASDRLGKDAENVDAVAVDITFTAPDGTELEPAEGSLVSVSIVLPEEQSLTDGEFSLLHVTDDGDVQEIADADVSADSAEFTTDSFSIYVVTAHEATEKSKLVMANGAKGNNSAGNPYIIGVGEDIEIWYENDDYTDCWFTVVGNDYPSNTHRIIRASDFTVGEESPNWYLQDRIHDGKLKAKFTGSTATTSSDTSPLYIVVRKKSESDENVAVDVDTLYLRVVDSPVYMYVGTERKLLDTAMNELNNSSDKTIYLLEGESYTLSLNGENRGSDFTVADSTVLTKGTPTNKNGNTDVTFTAAKHGKTTITVNGQTINVEVKHQMYVKDELHERDIDRINEWVSAATGWISKQNGYIANSPYYYPYQLFDGDNLTLHVPEGDIDGAKLVLSNSSALSIESGSLSADNGSINVTLTAHNTTDEDINVAIELKDKDDNLIRTMYVKIPKASHEFLDHADIEIADGGKYTVTKLKRNKNGSYEKTVSEYRAYVSGVNGSVLYQSEDDSETCQFYDKNNDPYPKDEITGYAGSEYYVDPNVPKGSPQYEFTSKYEIYADGGLNWDSIGRIKFYPSDVDHVVFDVELTLEPKSETTYTSSNGTTWVEGATVPITDRDDKILDSVLFNMNHQAVLDAYNKCPNHTGLDFTIMAFSALVEFDLEKELTGGGISAGQFTFGVYDSEDNLLSTATNGADKIVTFDSLHFEKAGTYPYKIKEIAGDDPSIIYDDKVIELNITVSEDPATNKLTAEITSDLSNFYFTNHHTYTLPSTGGTGELPYIIFGTAMISGALLLLYRRRKKEVSR
ncbi:MAG: LPXTG cell wall anchor domain-containing protein [Ruminococcus sp.]|nr:LPXTG cell wall anchor domain-containing protein [Ruminococcus sp.]